MILRWFLPVVLGLFLGLAGPALVQAAAVQPETPSSHDAHSGNNSGGSDLFKTALDLAIWTVVVFLILLVVLTKFAWKPLLEGLQQREKNIENALEEARKARDEAKELRDRYQKEMDNAHDTVRAILDEARRDAQNATEEMVAKARAEIQAERDRLRREIQTAKDQALQEIWNQTARLATDISARMLPRQLTPDDQRRLMDTALAELGSRGNGARG